MKLKSPLMAGALFEIICERLARKKKLPDILEYWNSSDDMTDIKLTDWEMYGKVQFGGSEGIYLDIHIEGYIENYDERKDIYIGCFKTLYDEYNAFKTMCILNADFIFEEKEFYRENPRIFDWTGYAVDCYKDGKNVYPFFVREEPSRDMGIFQDPDYDYFIITNLATREYTFVAGKEE